MKRVLLIDADIYAYRAALAIERAVNWSAPEAGDGPGALWTLHADAEEAFGKFGRLMDQIRDRLRPDRMLLALSDTASWRRDVSASYKENRAGARKPLALPALRERVQREFETETRPGLEGDDVIGLRLTEPATNEERICVSVDKDLRGVPGLHADDRGRIARVNREAADRWHLVQTLAGDPADGYAGCPGVGLETAKAFAATPYELSPTRRRIARGTRAGAVETRWEKQPTRNLWRGVVSFYRRAGLGEAEALVQARLARILRHGELDAAGRPVPWRPEWLRLSPR